MTVLDPKRMRRLRRLKTVPRWVVVPTINKQTVDQHTFHTMWIFVWLYDYLFCESPTAEELLGVMFHDDDEAITGDAPGPSKIRAEIDYSSETKEKLILKIADYLEAYLFIFEDQEMGNQRGTGVILKDISIRATPWVKELNTRGLYPGKWEFVVTDFLNTMNQHPHPLFEGRTVDPDIPY